MTEALLVIVSGFLVIAAAALAGPRLRIASPLVLVAVGVAAGFLPIAGSVHIEPEWILEGVLPPLLYSSAVSMPAMNFRREFGAISGLSVVLVVGSSLLLGVFFMTCVREIGFAWGVALGAIISPTDAVATSIIKRLPVSKRVVALLDGESLLNDASALVMLRTAMLAAAGAFSFWGSAGRFAWSIAAALVIGAFVGKVNLIARKRITDPAVNTVISFAVPFAASVPASLAGASGLVAAVVAGLVTGIRAPRILSPRNRLSDSQNWRTVELVLEGAIFLTMGLQIRSIVADVSPTGVGRAVLIAAGALVLTILVRAAYVAPLLGVLGGRSRHGLRMHPRVQEFQQHLSTPEGKQKTLEKLQARGRKATERDLERFARRVTRGLATIEYFLREPLGWREGTAVVWAGMRGAVTVAAAQTLGEDTPQRAMLVLIAYSVAAMSLVVQGGTIGPVMRLLSRPAPAGPSACTPAAGSIAFVSATNSIMELLRSVSESIPAPTGEPDFGAARTHRLEVIAAQRDALLDARDNGTFDADVLADALANLDATEIAIDLRGKLAA